MSSRSPLVLAFALVMLAAVGSAAAQPGPTPTPAPAAGSAAAPAAGDTGSAAAAPAPTEPTPTAAPTAPPVAQPPAAEPARNAGTASYHSPMRGACEDELAKDHDWFDNLKSRLSEHININVHKDAVRYATTNNRHVVMAYAAFWLLTVGFVLVMWRRQRALAAEIARLEQELSRAVGGGS